MVHLNQELKDALSYPTRMNGTDVLITTEFHVIEDDQGYYIGILSNGDNVPQRIKSMIRDHYSLTEDDKLEVIIKTSNGKSIDYLEVDFEGELKYHGELTIRALEVY